MYTYVCDGYWLTLWQWQRRRTNETAPDGDNDDERPKRLVYAITAFVCVYKSTRIIIYLITHTHTHVRRQFRNGGRRAVYLTHDGEFSKYAFFISRPVRRCTPTAAELKTSAVVFSLRPKISPYARPENSADRCSESDGKNRPSSSTVFFSFLILTCQYFVATIMNNVRRLASSKT